MDQPTVNPNFYCPISGQVMTDPVSDFEGNTYERSAIENWLERNGTSPITRNRMSKDDLRPNRTLRNAIEDELASGKFMPTINDIATVRPVAVTRTRGPPADINVTISAKQAPSSFSECKDSEEEFLVLVKAVAPAIERRVPSDIVLVVDVSGSMGADATAQGVESSGLSLLDIVKHAVKTVINTLNDDDRLALVSYSNSANVIFDLMAMNSVGKDTAMHLLDNLSPGGMTNLWDGLQTGLRLLQNKSNSSRLVPAGEIDATLGNNAAVLLLTDGEPNIEPPRGHIPMLKRYCENNGGRYPGIISTFGFGYTLDSVLLRKVSVEGSGMYAFIPDSGFVGTAFVNSLSNILATVAVDVSLEIEGFGGAKVSPEGVLGNLPNTTATASGGVRINIGSIQTEQSVDYLFRVTLPKGHYRSHRGPDGAPLIKATLHYRSPGTTANESIITKDFQGPNAQHFVGSGSIDKVVSTRLDQEIDAQYFRLKVVSTIGELIQSMRDSTQLECQDNVRKIITALSEWLASHHEAGEPVPRLADGAIAKEGTALERIQALLGDAQGQISEAISRLDWYTRWGRHYLQSLQRAHELQQCNNFKDPGIQHYGGALFRSTRDLADDVFCQLPAPVPKVRALPSYLPGKAYDSNPAGGVPPPPSTVHFSMAAYNSRDQPCFHGDCNVAMSDGTWKQVKALQPGDELVGGGRIRCVVRTDCRNSRAQLVRLPVRGMEAFGDLLVTPWHPVKAWGKWTFPCTLGGLEEVDCEAIYSFLIEGGDGRYVSSLFIEGIECATLAHGITSDPVASHAFFGTEAVVRALEKCAGWTKGFVHFGRAAESGAEVKFVDSFTSGCLVRDAETGLVKGLALHLEIGAQ